MESKNDSHYCKVCGQKFRFLKALKKHELRHEGNGGFICRACGLSFTSNEDREKHRDKEHKVCRCKICNIKFSTESEYLKHINRLHEGRDRELSICSECGKQFKTKGELSHHVTSKCGTIKLYKCEVCEQTLMTAGSLHNHMLRHTGDRIYMCRFCAKTFLTAGQLTVHERIHTQEKAFVCEVCNKGFCHRQSLITHSSLHTGIKPYQCEGCGSAFSCVGNLLKHRKTHADSCALLPLLTHRVQHPATKFKVQVNTPPTSKIKQLQKRKKLEQQIWGDEPHQNQNTNIIDQSIENNFNQAETVENDKALLLLNMMPVKQTNSHLSPMTTTTTNETTNDDLNPDLSDLGDSNEPCQTKTDSDDSLDLYTRQLKLHSHTDKKKVNRKRKTKADMEKMKEFILKRGFDEKTGLNCQYCGAHYMNPHWMMKHELKHEIKDEEFLKNGQEYFKCSCCSRNFQSKEECAGHQQQEHLNQLKCFECDRMFANPDTMKAHTNFYHKGIPRKKYSYVCEKCGKMFKQKALLVVHEENKCSEGPLYRCDVCDKSFSSKHVQKSHMRIHLPEKSLLCKYCGKSFHWKGQLKIHERSHTGERPFKCSECSKSFAYRESLITHSTIHTGIKPHLCDGCGCRFSCIGNLLKHRRTHFTTCGVLTRVKTELIIT